MKIIPIATLLFSLLQFINSQSICPNCVDQNGLFLCNNLGCQGFSMLSGQNGPFNVNCMLNGGTSCYYQSSNQSGVVTYLFCNYTFFQCLQCNQNSCSQCLGGSYQYYFDPINSFSTCVLCNQTVPGCQSCTGQYCSQCYSQYYNSNGLCFTQEGNLVSGIDPFSSGGSVIAEIIMDFLILIITVIAIFLFYLFFIKDILAAKRTKNFKQNKKNNKLEVPKTGNQRTKRLSVISQMKYPLEIKINSVYRSSIQNQIIQQKLQQADQIKEENIELNRGNSQRKIMQNR